jgi:hypothetical protein
MLEQFKLSHMQGVFIFLLFASLTGAMFYYVDLINQGQLWVQDSYDCKRFYTIHQVDKPPQNSSEAGKNVATYINSQSGYNIKASNLEAYTAERHTVDVPTGIQESCTFREAGTPPPQCIGETFRFQGAYLNMSYEYPCGQ